MCGSRERAASRQVSLDSDEPQAPAKSQTFWSCNCLVWRDPHPPPGLSKPWLWGRKGEKVFFKYPQNHGNILLFPFASPRVSVSAIHTCHPSGALYVSDDLSSVGGPRTDFFTFTPDCLHVYRRGTRVTHMYRRFPSPKAFIKGKNSLLTIILAILQNLPFCPI